MAAFDYFSKDVNKRIRFIFNLIAGVYSLADKGLVKDYSQVVAALSRELDLQGKSILDIGTGTGAWAAALQQAGARLTGIDLSEKMLARAARKHPELDLVHANAEQLDMLEGQSFDFVTASFVLHGVDADRRKVLLREMQRITRQGLILHDFYGPTPYFVRFLEFMERSDYKNFKKHIEAELKEYFERVDIVHPKAGRALYLAFRR